MITVEHAWQLFDNPFPATRDAPSFLPSLAGPGNQVVVVYYKKTKRPPFRPPPALALVWKAGSKIVHRVRGSEQADEDGGSDDAKVSRSVVPYLVISKPCGCVCTPFRGWWLVSHLWAT